jgi:hypothetical protein
LRALAAGIGAPVIWLAGDLLITGNPLFSVTVHEHYGTLQHVAGGLGNALRQDRVDMTILIGRVALVGAVLGALVVLARPANTEHRAVPYGMGLAVACFTVFGLGGMWVEPRFLLVAAACGCAAFASLPAIVSRFPLHPNARRAVALALLVAAAASTLHRAPQFGQARSDVARQVALVTELEHFSRTATGHHALGHCPTIWSANADALPTALYLSGRTIKAIAGPPLAVPADALVLTPRSTLARSLYPPLPGAPARLPQGRAASVAMTDWALTGYGRCRVLLERAN